MKYVYVEIDNQKIELEEIDALPISLNYQIEDPESFQQKKGTESFGINIPATLINDKIFNTYHNPSIEDLTTGQIFKNHRACRIMGNGIELLVGKAFLKEATHTTKPLNYKIDCYGGNADWMIDLKESTMYEVFKDASFIFSKANIEASWGYTGSDPNLFYCFAPVKYATWLDSIAKNDNNFDLNSMKPSLSLYWSLFRGFKLAGYRIQSDFFDTQFFRRLLMPWTWGNFLDVSGEKYDIHKFRAIGTDTFYHGLGLPAILTPVAIPVFATNDFIDGGFDNNNTVINGDYQYFPLNNYEMQWKYNTPHYGPLEVTLSVFLDMHLLVTNNSNADVWVYWYKNGSLVHTDHPGHVQAPYITIGGATEQQEITETYHTMNVNPNDEVSARVFIRKFISKTGQSEIVIKMAQFQLEYFRIPLGGSVIFDGFQSFKKYKFLDLLRGTLDTFNLSITTDNTNKIVYMEPTHDSKYAKGFFNNDFIDWDAKQDLSKESSLELFSDYDREVIFKYKNDDADGIFKLIKDRHQNDLGAGKYVFPNRFKAGKKEFENRFFSACMHFDADQFLTITGIAPQFPVIVPENISNTSRSEAQNTFSPKLCFYKGVVSGVGGWKFDGTDLTTLPFMFAVNYKTGGEEDPILSYSDEKIGAPGSEVLGMGLLKRFFWQRLATMRNGQFYTSYFMLNNNDAARPLHREHKIIKGQKWELVSIADFRPLQSGSTKCFLRKYTPVTKEDFNFTYPTSASVLSGILGVDEFDIKYAQLKCVVSQIPTPE